MNHLALTVLFMFTASPEPVVLTPDNVAEYDYFFVCGVLKGGQERHAGRIDAVDEKVDAFLRSLGGERRRVDATDPVVVYLRFAPKRKGMYVLGAEDLQAITAVSLVLRDGEVVLSVPLHTKVDPGNYVHLHARFSVQKELLPKIQLRFEEHGEGGKRTFLANLNDFVDEVAPQ